MPLNFNKKVIFLLVIVILIIILTIVILISFDIISFSGKEIQKGDVLLAEVGNYQIFKEDREARITFEQCLNRSVNKTKVLGILSYFGFLEKLKQPLNINVSSQELDNEYNNLQQERRNSFIVISEEALTCLNENFEKDKDIFYKVVLKPPLLERKIQQAFDNLNINESYYEWMTNYLKSTIKIIVYDTEVCENVKSVYKDAWFRELIVCK